MPDELDIWSPSSIYGQSSNQVEPCQDTPTTTNRISLEYPIDEAGIAYGFLSRLWEVFGHQCVDVPAVTFTIDIGGVVL